MHLGLQTSQDELLKFKTSIKIWKKSDLRDFECGIVVVYVCNNSSTSETSDLSFKYGANSLRNVPSTLLNLWHKELMQLYLRKEGNN